MAYINYALRYNGILVYLDRFEGSSLNIIYNGQSHAITAGQTKTLACAGQVMRSDIVIGRKTLLCGGKIMRGNLILDTYAQAGADYDIITSNKVWKVPLGVKTIDAFVVGGGGGGGGCAYYNLDGNPETLYGQGGGGGGGGFITRAVLRDFTPGVTEYNAVIGAGGAGGSIYEYTSTSQSQTYHGNNGGDGGTTTFGPLTAAGGRGGSGASDVASGVSGGGSPGGNGGSGGGGGAGWLSYSQGNTSWYNDYGGAGGSNGGNGGQAFHETEYSSSAPSRSNFGRGWGGSGAGVSSIFLGVAYAAGGGGGAIGYDRYGSSGDYYATGKPGASGSYTAGLGAYGCGGQGGGSDAYYTSSFWQNAAGKAGTPGIIVLKLNY